ncbi:MAG: prolyl-tRNA synthetase associated domain-containing protein [Clostridia bacterium]|nr:prolyl-tRNA synthetase associated domain-containing protein [Clostridia bacterium]
MTEQLKQSALAFLDQVGIAYELMEHVAVFTVEEMEAAGINARGGVCKNLFLRDAKGKNHFLVVAPEEKRVDIAAVAQQLGASKLSFASAERLQKYLGVAQGSVSPLGVLNDAEHAVTVVFDRDLLHAKRVGVHPNDNTATVWLSFQDLKKAIESIGNEIAYVKV